MGAETVCAGTAPPKIHRSDVDACTRAELLALAAEVVPDQVGLVETLAQALPIQRNQIHHLH